MHCLIIGANRGIGLALTKKFQAEGYTVSAACRKSSPELEKLNVAVYENIDVCQKETLEDLANKCGEIDVLIHNAGVLISDSIETIDSDQIRKQFEVNTLGPLNSVMALKNNIKAGGKIGLMTSRMGSITDNTSGGQYGYRVSKTALNAVGKSLAEDLKSEDKTVLLLHPGYVRTDMTAGNGLIDTTESAEGLFKIMQSKSLNQTGTFWHTNGEELPW